MEINIEANDMRALEIIELQDTCANAAHKETFWHSAVIECMCDSAKLASVPLAAVLECIIQADHHL